MYKCCECGHLFECGEEKNIKQDYGELKSVCPICNGTFDEAERCEICEEYVFAEDIQYREYCKNCAENTRNKFESMLQEFTQAEIKALNDIYEGVEFGR